MYNNSEKTQAGETKVSEPVRIKPSKEEKANRMVQELNKTIHERPLLKQYFYTFLMKNNSEFMIFDQEDVDAFEAKRKAMDRKNMGVFASISALFGGLYLMRGGWKRTTSKWSYGVKLLGFFVILPIVPSIILGNKMCEKDRQDLIQIADKYPVHDERLYREFIAHAQPRLKDKYYSELDKKKEHSQSSSQ